MGISKIKIENFKTISRLQLKLEENGIICLLGKNGAGKTTVINAINYLYKIAEEPYKIEQVIDKKNPYVQKMIIELFFETFLYRSNYNCIVSASPPCCPL